MKTLFLIGFMGSGKSSIGRMLSKELNVPEIEMDDEIVRREGMSINAIFAQNGEPYFRQKESELLKELGERCDCIVSCGGGVPMREENIEIMKKTGICILLSASPETIYERVKDDTERPLLKGHMNVEYIGELMEKRAPHYAQAADYSVSVDGKSREEICGEIRAILPETGLK